MTFSAEPSTIMDRVHAALIPHGPAGATASAIADAAGLTTTQILSAFHRGEGRWFRQIGKTRLGNQRTYAAILDEKKRQPFKLPPIYGGKRQRDAENIALNAQQAAAAARPAADTYGHFEVRHVNAHGFTVSQPCSSRAWAEQLAAECGGEVARRKLQGASCK